MPAVRREPLSGQIVALLLERIAAGEWAVGAKLPGETTLASQFGVGRSTMREAIRDLAGRGVLASRQGSGVFIASLRPVDEWERSLSRADIASVIEARTAIEVESSALAAERRTSDDLADLAVALRERGERRSSIEERVDVDTAFHRAIVIAAHNPILLEIFDGFSARSRPAMIDLLHSHEEPNSEADQQGHARILAAIEARDPLTAADLTRRHLVHLRDRLG